MIETAESSFNDLCDIHTPTITYNSFGEPKKEFATTSDVECGFNPSNAEQTNRGQLITLDCDAILRLALTQSISAKDEITCRGVRYKIDGITIGNTVKRITLKRTDGNEQAN